MPDKIKILYVDDEPNNLNSFKAYFRIDYEIHTCLSGEEALQILKNTHVHIIVAHQKMSNMTGVEFITQSNIKTPEPIKIVVTTHREIEAIEIAFEKGYIFRYHQKPWDWDDLKNSIEDAYILYCQNNGVTK
ncbi:MAG: response regulator [Cytophagaceae bacterium]|nr:response regulator [Cytophagaceae bacterium]